MSTETTEEELIAAALGGLNRLPTRVEETDQNPNSISRRGGAATALTCHGRPYMLQLVRGSRNFIGWFVPMVVNFPNLTVAVVQGDNGNPITYDSIFTPDGKVTKAAGKIALILFNTHEKQRLYDPENDNSQDMASTADPTGGFVYTCLHSNQRYGWFMVPAPLIDGLTIGQRMSVMLQVRQLVFEEWTRFRYQQIEQEAHNPNETQELRQAQAVVVHPSPTVPPARTEVTGLIQAMQLSYAQQLEQNAFQREQNQANQVAIGDLSRNVGQLTISTQAAVDTAQAASTTAQAALGTAQDNKAAIDDVNSSVNVLDNRQQVLENNQRQDHEILQDVTSELDDLTLRQELQDYRQQETDNNQRDDRERNNALQAQQRQTNEEQRRTNHSLQVQINQLTERLNVHGSSSQATTPVAQANAQRTLFVFGAGSKKPPRVPTPSRPPPPSTPSRGANNNRQPPANLRRSPRNHRFKGGPEPWAMPDPR